MLFNSAIWPIAAVAMSSVIARPWNWPKFVWAVARVAMLFNLLSWQEVVAAVRSGTDVYLFLIGMMLRAQHHVAIYLKPDRHQFGLIQSKLTRETARTVRPTGVAAG